MTGALRLSDNPLFVKHVRSRLRRNDLLLAATAVFVAGALIVWGGVVTRSIENGTAFVALLVGQAVILHLLGPFAVATSVVYARQTGILDFHRISPETPLAVALGFALGAPVREYVLFACTLPFSLIFLALGYPSPAALLWIVLAMLLASVLHNCLTALVTLTVSNLQQAVGNAVAAVMLLHFGGYAQSGALTAIPVAVWALYSGDLASELQTFFGAPFPVPALCVLHQGPVLFFVLTALTRKLRSEFMPPLSKGQAVALFLSIGTLIVGDVWWLADRGAQAVNGTAPLLVVLYALELGAVALSFTVTPGLGQFSRGVRRARKLGAPASAWSDDASSWAPMAGFACVVVALGGLALASSGPDPMGLMRGVAAILACVFAVSGLMNCHQYFVLRAPKGGTSILALVVFLWWLVPLPIAAVLASLGSDGLTASAIASLSPLAGIAMSVTDAPEVSSLAPIIAFLAPALVTAVFGVLRGSIERLRAEQALEAASLALLPPGPIP